MKIDFGNEKTRDAISGIGVIGGILLMLVGIAVSPPKNTDEPDIFMDENGNPDSVLAINALYKRAEKACFDSNKVKIAHDIFDIAKNSNDPHAIAAAIGRIDAISNSCDFSSNQTECSYLIKKLVID